MRLVVACVDQIYVGKMYRNPSPPPGVESAEQITPVSTVTSILLKLLQGIENNTIDAGSQVMSDFVEDTPYERTLCGAWDLASVEEYAVALMECKAHRVLLKIITTSARTRTRELAMGTLANLSCHWDVGVGLTLIDDGDLVKVVGMLLLEEADSRTLVETSRFLKSTLTNLLDPLRTPNAHPHISDILTRQNLFQHYVFIITNTLNPELLLESLRTLYWILVYLYANALTFDVVLPEDALFLIRWGTERLEEEGAGFGVGVNREVAKAIMDLLLAVFRSGCVKKEECGDLAPSLASSVRHIMLHIQEDDDKQDEEIQRLAAALTDGLVVRNR
ncbi:hypothetical protein BC937DRAFT_90303 [Endogone sp. FLAS-F59071]|nr:hypothetical protein BC937DRAFT_90303 [Endogone sp. FLAS-F59071]|eukprot:RUS17173.1 hypothetical protein BC937DRAFT_90303 [Endogone sp. FLAS-F59071]